MVDYQILQSSGTGQSLLGTGPMFWGLGLGSTKVKIFLAKNLSGKKSLKTFFLFEK
jgi:hypothetical protein